MIAKNVRAGLSAWLTICLFGLALTAKAQPDVDGHPDSNAFYLIPPDTDDWTRHFHIGGMVGLNISGNFHMNGNFTVAGNNPSKGLFDDGYVRVDQTGNAGGLPGVGLTSFWGYNNASQYDAANHRLAMHAVTGFSATESSSSDVAPSPGFDLAYGANYWYWKHARVGWEMGFDLLPISLKDNHPLSATANSATYFFDTGNLILPGAPYQGGSSGVGPVISGAPSSIVTNGATSTTATGSRTLDAIIYSVRLGPSFEWDMGEHMGMSLSAGPAVGIVSGTYSFNEDISVGGGPTAHNNGSFSNVGIQYGGYFNATFMYHITSSADFYLGAQYMSMTDYNISSGGRSANLDLSGQVYVSAGISWPF